VHNTPSLPLQSRAVRLLSRMEAKDLVEQGTPLAIDPCGDECVGIRWPTTTELRHHVERGFLLKRRTKGVFLLCRTEDGTSVVLLTGGDLRD